MQRFNRPGIWLGIIAVVFAMSGSAYAASKITGAQIKDGTITSKDIKNDTIGITDISQKLFDELKSDSGVAGPVGPQGPAGPAGASGSPTTITAVESAHFSLAPGQYSPNVLANCPPGTKVIGTGFFASIAHISFVKAYTYFVGGFIYNDANSTATDLYFQAMCASTGGAVAAGAHRSDPRYTSDRAHAAARVSCTRAKIGGKSKCLARGQFCSKAYRSQYKRYGFTCGANGRLR